MKSKSIQLIPLSADCESAYVKFYTDKEASGPYGGPLTKGAAFNRLLSDVGSWHILGFGVWAIQELETNKIVGVCGFWQGKGWPIELTWWLLPEARGKGLAQEASKLAIDYAYIVLKWETVETYMKDENEAAKNLVLSLGGKLVKRQSFPDGVERNVYRFSKGII